MTTQSIKPCSRKFQLFIGLNSNDAIGLAYKVAVVICKTQTNFLFFACYIEQCYLKKISRFLKIFIRLRFECSTRLWNNSYHHLGKMHFLCIEVRFTSTKQCTRFTIFLFYINLLQRIGTICNHFYLVERLLVHHIFYIGNCSLDISSVYMRFVTFYGIRQSTKSIQLT